MFSALSRNMCYAVGYHFSKQVYKMRQGLDIAKGLVEMEDDEIVNLAPQLCTIDERNE
jgi:hypothetical protein